VFNRKPRSIRCLMMTRALSFGERNASSDLGNNHSQVETDQSQPYPNL